MATINREWHQLHKMPKNPTSEQRIAWHVEHAKHCRCRPIPEGVYALMQRVGVSLDTEAPISTQAEP